MTANDVAGEPVTANEPSARSRQLDGGTAADGFAPDFFVIGAYRCGTTSLTRSLAQHPEVYLPPEKEPMFYAIDGNPAASPVLRSRSITTAAAYAELFAAAAPGQQRGDISPEYLTNPAVPARVHATHPDAPLVAILRNPIERAWSDFLLHRRDGNEPCETLTEALEQQAERQADGDHRAGHYIDTGMYATQLRRWLELFPRDQILILLYEDLVADRPQVMRSIFDHIGVAPDFEVVEEHAVNASGVPTNPVVAAVLRSRAKLRPFVPRSVIEKVRPAWEAGLSRVLTKPKLTDDDRAVLIDIYREDVGELAKLLGRNLDHWLEP